MAQLIDKDAVLAEIDFEQELYKAFGHVKDFTLCLKIARRFYEMGRNHQEPVSDDLEKIVEEIAEPTILNAYGTKELARRLRNTICGTSVIEELEEACEQLAENARKHKAETLSPFFSQTDYKQGVIDGAKWKEEQFEKNRLAACDRQTEKEAEIEQSFVMGIIENEHRQPTFDDAIKYGMRLQKEQLMASGTDVIVHIEAGNYPYIPQIELYDYDKDIPLAKEGDKYNVILIKED